jgi:hypothetical protein
VDLERSWRNIWENLRLVLSYLGISMATKERVLAEGFLNYTILNNFGGCYHCKQVYDQLESSRSRSDTQFLVEETTIYLISSIKAIGPDQILHFW